MKTTPANLLNTGGWDSTFRLLQLLLIEKRPVQPIYILDPERWSLPQELQAMAKIKNAVLARFPEAEEYLLPTIMYDRTDVKPDPELADHAEKLVKKIHFGGQYEWLARATKQFGIENAEICIENDFGQPVGCYATVHTLLEEGQDGMRRVAEREGHEHEFAVFGMFTFPIVTLTKVDMKEIAQQHDFLDILEMSWFCHRPNFLGEACGTCNPCRIAMSHGMAHRVPPLGRFCYRVATILDIRPLVRKWPALFNLLKKIKGGRAS
jgi:hypothetical protein